MRLNKEKIAEWISQRYADDYFKFYLVSHCADIEVESYQQEDAELTVVYNYWDDGQYASDCQDYFLFDIKVASNYGVNFPKVFQLVRCTDKYGWSTSEECLALSENLIDLEEVDVEIEMYHWGDPEVEQFIAHYVSDLYLEKEFAEMLIEAYDAKNGLPSFIPDCLVPHFEKIVSEYS
jgi:hypothetical protein